MLNWLRNLRGNGNKLPSTAGKFLNTKKPSRSWDIQKIMKKT